MWRTSCTRGSTFIAAGSETTAKTLSIIWFHLLDNPSKLEKVRSELQNLPLEASWGELQRLPYLSAVVNEGLRLNFGITGRTQVYQSICIRSRDKIFAKSSKRVAPDEDLQCRNWIIPTGTPISMMSLFMHTNEDIFPDPWIFMPERWLQSERKDLHRYLVSFGKGSRRCIAINLAHAEIFLTLAAIARRCDMRLFDTDARDVEFRHDFVVLHPQLNTKGVRVTVEDRYIK